MTLKQNGTARQRLDQLMVAQGLVATRSRARDLVLRGKVQVNGEIAKKASHMLGADAEIAIAPGEARFVSRGAHKLVAGLDAFSFSCDGVRALDVGASTGGFTQVLLERGAADIIAVDVGQGQLAPQLAYDPRVRSIEQTDARTLAAGGLVSADRSAIVCDVSFISVLKVLPHVIGLAADAAFLVVLIKPQFEVGPDHVGKGGIVRDGAQRDKAVAAVHDWLSLQDGWTLAGVIPAPITGGDGNLELLIGAYRG
ncbi:MAG: TlyA family RNA methyltransferase [Pseudomonadota bacterium]